MLFLAAHDVRLRKQTRDTKVLFVERLTFLKEMRGSTYKKGSVLNPNKINKKSHKRPLLAKTTFPQYILILISGSHGNIHTGHHCYHQIQTILIYEHT